MRILAWVTIAALLALGGASARAQREPSPLLSERDLNTLTCVEIVQKLGGTANKETLKNLAERGDTNALLALGMIADPACGAGASDQKLATANYLAAAQAGNARAMNAYGNALKGGKGPLRYNLAVDWFRKSAEAGNAFGMSNLGRSYLDGTGIAKSEADAYLWNLRAAQAGNVRGMTDTGWQLLNGSGVQRTAANKKAGADWLAAASERGDTFAMYTLARYYEDAYGRLSLARPYYIKAAEGGNIDAMFRVAELIEKCVMTDIVQYGYCLPNYDAMLGWYRRAADAGSVSGIASIGYVMQLGHGPGKTKAENQAESVIWLKRAADLGDHYAMNNLGWAYEKGLGVAASEEQARAWYKKAAQLGNKTASDNLSLLGRRDQVAADRKRTNARLQCTKECWNGDPDHDYARCERTCAARYPY